MNLSQLKAIILLGHHGALTVLLVLGIVPMLLAFTWAGSTYAWTSPQVLGLLLLAAVACIFLREIPLRRSVRGDTAAK